MMSLFRVHCVVLIGFEAIGLVRTFYKFLDLEVNFSRFVLIRVVKNLINCSLSKNQILISSR